eukprot:8937144-Lingulodinium_polyedra.AAC.1
MESRSGLYCGGYNGLSFRVAVGFLQWALLATLRCTVGSVVESALSLPRITSVSTRACPEEPIVQPIARIIV